MFCGNCGTKIDENQNKCLNCGWIIPSNSEKLLNCLVCGVINKNNAVFCGSCGAKINSANEYTFNSGKYENDLSKYFIEYNFGTIKFCHHMHFKVKHITKEKTINTYEIGNGTLFSIKLYYCIEISQKEMIDKSVSDLKKRFRWYPKITFSSPYNSNFKGLSSISIDYTFSWLHRFSGTINSFVMNGYNVLIIMNRMNDKRFKDFFDAQDKIFEDSLEIK